MLFYPFPKETMLNNFRCHVPSWPGTVATFGHHRVDKYAVDCFRTGWVGVGWGGVGMMTFFELEHMVDAMWMLRNSVCLVTAHMVDATQPLCLVIAHMVDATQLCLSCHCTHGGCYATLCVLSLQSWWMLRNSVCLELAR